jgi:hypothetical protein
LGSARGNGFWSQRSGTLRTRWAQCFSNQWRNDASRCVKSRALCTQVHKRTCLRVCGAQPRCFKDQCRGCRAAAAAHLRPKFVRILRDHHLPSCFERGKRESLLAAWRDEEHSRGGGKHSALLVRNYCCDVKAELPQKHGDYATPPLTHESNNSAYTLSTTEFSSKY